VFFAECALGLGRFAELGVAVLTGRSFKATLERLSLGATVYQIWWQQNDLMHHNTLRTEESILAQIKWEVRGS